MALRSVACPCIKDCLDCFFIGVLFFVLLLLLLFVDVDVDVVVVVVVVVVV